MRKVEKLMVEAIKQGKNFSLQNTRVEHRKVEHEGNSLHTFVYLHGNMIADFCFERESVYFTTSGWATRTTMSRLNALAQSFCINLHFGIKNFTPTAYRLGKVDPAPTWHYYAVR